MAGHKPTAALEVGPRLDELVRQLVVQTKTHGGELVVVDSVAAVEGPVVKGQLVHGDGAHRLVRHLSEKLGSAM